jgi:GAF domain-containing protein
MTMDAILTAMASPTAQPMTMLAAVGRFAETLTGARLVTLMTIEPDVGSAERIWSNMPDAYPVSGRKPLNRTDWFEIVVERQQPFVANSIDEVAAVFDDHALIRSLGCESCLNLPIVVAGQVIGSINCLDGAGHWTAERLAKAQALILPGALAYLIHRNTKMERVL